MTLTAIDDPTAAGKGAISNAVATHFGFTHLDTGLQYRAVGVVAEATRRNPARVTRHLNLSALSLRNLRTGAAAAYREAELRRRVSTTGLR